MKLDLEAALTHACAGVALAYAYRCAGFAASWVRLPLLGAEPAAPLPLLSIVVPVRNEERSIERCLRSLLAQEWLDFEVIAIDDRSTDSTPAILERLARDYPRLLVVRGEALPEGWIGKPWALVQGAKVARGSWLLFTDADSVHASRGAATALWFALAARVDALSIATGQELGSFWERALLPSVLGLILYVSGTFAELNDPERPDKALANGQYILVSRDAYDGLGGHHALRGEIVEDVAFAKRLKADGRYRMLLVGGDELASVRMYRSLAEIWAGFTKNVFVGAQGDVRAIGVGIAFAATISLAPIALAATAAAHKRYDVLSEALATSLAVVATASWGMRRAAFDGRLALLHPLGTALFAAIMLDSTVRIASGRGVVWSGRRYFARARG